MLLSTTVAAPVPVCVRVGKGMLLTKHWLDSRGRCLLATCLTAQGS